MENVIRKVPAYALIAFSERAEGTASNKTTLGSAMTKNAHAWRKRVQSHEKILPKFPHSSKQRSASNPD